LWSPDEKERAWRDTQGYPYCVQLWIEEAEAGGRSAVMLKRFHDRTTRWMGEREKRWLQHVLFLSAVDIPSLQAMLGNETEGEEAFRWFEGEGSVRDTAGSPYRVREYLRSRLVDYLRACDHVRCESWRVEATPQVQHTTPKLSWATRARSGCIRVGSRGRSMFSAIVDAIK